MTRFAPSPATLFHLAAAALIGLPSAAQVTFNGSEAPVLTLHSRGTLTLTVANRGDAAPRHWNWAPPADLTRQGARLEIIGPDQAAFHAPPTLEEHTYAFRVTSADAAGIVGEIRIRVVPDTQSGGERGLMDRIMPGAFDTTPDLRVFLGKVDEDPAHASPHPFKGAIGLGFLTGAGLGPMDRRLLVSDETGIHAISMLGVTTPAPWLPMASGAGEEYGSLAVRPADCRNPAVPPVVYTVTRRNAAGLAHTSELWAASPGAPPRRLGEGLVAPSRKGPLAMDTAGNVYFWDLPSRELRRLDLGGHVMVLAGSRGVGGDLPKDGTGTAATFQQVRSMVLEPSTGDLYVSDSGCIRKVTPSGVVTTPLAWWRPQELADQRRDLAKDTTSVAGQPHPVAPNLAIYGRDLYLLDFDLGEGLFAFNLDSKRFVTVIPGALDLFIHTRFGPIRHLAPGTPEAASALLGTIQHRGPLVITPEGTGILAMGAGLMEADLPREGSVTTRGAAAPAAPGGH